MRARETRPEGLIRKPPGVCGIRTISGCNEGSGSSGSGDSQRLVDSLQLPVAMAFRCRCGLLRETAAMAAVGAVVRSAGVASRLLREMRVAGRSEELGRTAKRTIRADLFDTSRGQAFLVIAVRLVRPGDNCSVVPRHALPMSPFALDCGPYVRVRSAARRLMAPTMNRRSRTLGSIVQKFFPYSSCRHRNTRSSVVASLLRGARAITSIPVLSKGGR